MKRIVLPILCYCGKCRKRVYKKDRISQHSLDGGYSLLSRCCNAVLIYKTSQEEFPPAMDTATIEIVERNQRAIANAYRIPNEKFQKA